MAGGPPDFPAPPAEPPTYEIVGVEHRDGVAVQDLRIAVSTGHGRTADAGRASGPIEAYRVEPEPSGNSATNARGPRLLFAHWYDPQAPNGNRTEFLSEAVDWARERGATAILPQLTFPWHGDPDGSAADVARIVAEVSRLRRCLDLMVAAPGVDATRIAVVGHDFGAMHAAILGTVDRRPVAYVLIAAVPRWGDWFLPFWQIDEDRIDYLRALRPLDPIEHLGKVAPARLLFQFALRDFYIAPMAGFEFRRAAGEGAEVKSYDAEHDMGSPEARIERTAFLEEALGPD